MTSSSSWSTNAHDVKSVPMSFSECKASRIVLFQGSQERDQQLAIISGGKVKVWPRLAKISSNVLHAGAKIHIVSKNSHIENPNFHKIHILKISFFTKFTISKSHFLQNSHFQNLIFHKIHISKISFFTKFTFQISHSAQNSHSEIFQKYHF